MKYARGRSDGSLEAVYVVSEGVAEATNLQKIALPINHDQRQPVAAALKFTRSCAFNAHRDLSRPQ